MLEIWIVAASHETHQEKSNDEDAHGRLFHTKHVASQMQKATVLRLHGTVAFQLTLPVSYWQDSTPIVCLQCGFAAFAAFFAW